LRAALTSAQRVNAFTGFVKAVFMLTM